MIDEHTSATRNWHHQLWSLLMLELWHRKFIDIPVDAALPRYTDAMAS
jgi:hypothetical protein